MLNCVVKKDPKLVCGVKSTPFNCRSPGPLLVIKKSLTVGNGKSGNGAFGDGCLDECLMREQELNGPSNPDLSVEH